jgi:transcriptional adapter 3
MFDYSEPLHNTNGLTYLAPSSPEAAKAAALEQQDPSQADSNREAASTTISTLSRTSQSPAPTTLLATEKLLDGKANPESPGSDSSLREHQPTPAPAIPQYQTFGPDPSTFEDPTIYHIRPVTPGMSEEEKREIYSVAEYPHDDLHDLIPGTPPDRDLSNAKPQSQIAPQTFASYLEPYFRPLSEEDLAFLRERVGNIFSTFGRIFLMDLVV